MLQCVTCQASAFQTIALVALLCPAIACEPSLHSPELRAGACLPPVALSCLADIESLDESLLDSKYMTDPFVGEEAAVKVAHH